MGRSQTPSLAVIEVHGNPLYLVHLLEKGGNMRGRSIGCQPWARLVMFSPGQGAAGVCTSWVSGMVPYRRQPLPRVPKAPPHDFSHPVLSLEMLVMTQSPIH